ncbi:MAG: response regulator transcription factor [Gorillibacterium sp.]|nr:response regulator transcription factor [Gorillibacterium sp.]
MAKQILYVEDDEQIGKWVRDHLKERGYTVTWLTSGDQAAEFAETSDLIILDVMLPGLDGFTVGQRLKKSFPTVPVLMLSARSSIEDKLTGLDFADDYLTKPFHPDELTARIEVLLRRSGKLSAQIVALRHLLVYPEENRILDTRTNEEIALTGKQHQIFHHLLNHPNQILTKEQIYEAVWREPYMDGDKTLMVHIRYLREKLECDPSSPEIVETVRGIGYRVRV